jgi:three-Cys-motif partner protein
MVSSTGIQKSVAVKNQCGRLGVNRDRALRSKARAWDFWTQQKLAMLADYLPAFNKASSLKAPQTLYLDLFAGRDRNLSRATGEEISGSPRVALDAVPRFAKVVLFELPQHAAGLEADLRASYPNRDLEVIPGDCNDNIRPVLERLRRGEWNWAPTFALLDQQAAEIRWSTMEALADFKRKARYKLELWLLFAPSMLPRGLAVDDHGGEFAERITQMYGSQEWLDAYEARRRGLLSPGELRDELLNLMRWRLENVLGYKVTHHFEMKNTHGSPLYNMIFATDNDAGEKIMKHIYGKAASQRPIMQREAAARREAEREAESNAPGLFDPIPKAVKSEVLYSHRPPNPPYRLPD